MFSVLVQCLILFIMSYNVKLIQSRNSIRNRNIRISENFSFNSVQIYRIKLYICINILGIINAFHFQVRHFRIYQYICPKFFYIIID